MDNGNNNSAPRGSARERGRGQVPRAEDASNFEDALLGDPEYEQAFGERLEHTLDVDTWASGIDWEQAVARIKAEVADAVAQEEQIRNTIRSRILPKLKQTLPEAGVYRAALAELEKVHDGLLFPGRVEAVDGTVVTYDSLPIGITQIGIAIVSYGGVSATFSQRIFRKEIASKQLDPLEQALEVINQRDGRGSVGRTSAQDRISELGRRGIMAYAERKILVDKCRAEWRIGHGQPCPYELLTGSGQMTLLERALEVMRRMIDFRQFVFVPSAPRERGLLTIGSALDGGEYVILNTMEAHMEAIVAGGHYDKRYRSLAEQFVRDCGPNVIMGLFRASDIAPPSMFYAHREVAHLAVRVAMADSVLRPERGFPMLIDVADVTCKSAFGADGFLGLVHQAYAQAGAPLRYSNERDTRR